MCRQACLEDERCRAYTYVKPGVQGPKARCYFKDPAPAATADACCVSGVKQRAPTLDSRQRTGSLTFGGASSTEVDVRRFYPDGADLYWRTGDFVFRDVKEVSNDQGAQRFLFDISKVPNAKAVLWQLGVKPFAPFAGDSPTTWYPDGVVASGLVGGRTYFDVDVEAAVVEAKRQSRQPTLIFGDGRLCEGADCDGFRFIACGGGDGRGELISNPVMRGHRLDWCKHAGSECGEPAATLYCREIGYERAIRWSIDPKVGAGAVNQEQWTFYLRIVPLNGPAIAGKPSNVMRILYDFPSVPSDFRFYNEEKSRTPAPAVELSAFRYRAHHTIGKWPDGCKVATGTTRRPPRIVRALKKTWNAIDGIYEKAKNLVVDAVDRMTFGAIPKDVWAFGLDAAMMYAGVPPDLPNLRDMIAGGLDPKAIAAGALEQAAGAGLSQLASGGVEFLASEMADSVLEAIPPGSIVPGTGNILADVVLSDLEGEARGELEERVRKAIEDPARSLDDKVRYVIESRARNALEESSSKLAKAIKKKYEYCVSLRLQPTYFATVRNTSGHDIPDFTIEVSDTEEIFEPMRIEVMLRAGQTMTIPLSPEKNVPHLIDRWQLVKANVNEEISFWWNELYLKRPTNIILRSTGDLVCRDPLGPRGLVCETEMKSIYVSPQARALNRDYNLLQ